MATEIERKFLVKETSYKLFTQGVLYRQGYLNRDKERTVRIRVAGDQAFVTIKGITNGAERLEFEYPIPVQEAHEMLESICLKPLIEKYRYKVFSDGHLWEVDEFIGDNAGLTVAEVELKSSNEEVTLPPWIGKEVTGDLRYYNSNLVVHPYNEWNRVLVWD